MNPNTTAFPAAHFGDGGPGLTKRELFAAMVASNIWSNKEALLSARDMSNRPGDKVTTNIAVVANEQADALLAELAKEKP